LHPAFQPTPVTQANYATISVLYFSSSCGNNDINFIRGQT
jgi:hypothetical protein